MNWEVLITIASVIVTNLVTIITLYVHLDNKTENRLQKTDELISEIRNEMKDFHGRLERQDAEFKAGFLLLQEKMLKT